MTKQPRRHRLQICQLIRARSRRILRSRSRSRLQVWNRCHIRTVTYLPTRFAHIRVLGSVVRPTPAVSDLSRSVGLIGGSDGWGAGRRELRLGAFARGACSTSGVQVVSVSTGGRGSWRALCAAGRFPLAAFASA